MKASIHDTTIEIDGHDYAVEVFSARWEESYLTTGPRKYCDLDYSVLDGFGRCMNSRLDPRDVERVENKIINEMHDDSLLSRAECAE